LSQKLDARQKQNMREKTRFVFGAINPPPLSLPPFVRNCVPAPNQACGGVQNSLNRDPFQYITPKHDVHTSGTLRAGFVDFLPQKFPRRFSNVLKYVSLLFFMLHELRNGKYELY